MKSNKIIKIMAAAMTAAMLASAGSGMFVPISLRTVSVLMTILLMDGTPP